METASILLIEGWALLGCAIAGAALVIFLNGLDDTFLDLSWLIARLFTRERKPTDAMLETKAEQWAAIFVPAWQEDAVIAAMLRRLGGTMNYRNFRIFVAVYPNDPATQDEVRKAADETQQVQMVVLDRPGPTSKADALNQLVAASRTYEQLEGIRFGFTVLHDAEDVVHPMALKVMNWYIEFASMVQLPVLSLNRKWHQLVAGTYMDEFAELHSKEMWLRSRVNRQVPSSGVATAFAREAFTALEHEGPIFDAESLVEDYDISHRLAQVGHRSMFVWHRTREGEIVATRELFPHQYTPSVRQKTRWLLGIVYFGWRKLGWYGSAWNRYFLYRDRKILFGAVSVIIAYILAALVLCAQLACRVWPELGTLPPLIEAEWVLTIIAIDLGFLVSRLAQRMVMTGRIHGPVAGLMSPLRVVLGNFVAFHSLSRATKQFFGFKLKQRKVAWDKTDHQFPTAALVLSARPKVTDILHHAGRLSAADARRACEYAKTTGRRLALGVQDLGLCRPEHIAQALAERLSLPFVALDEPLTEDLFALFSRTQSERYSVLARRSENGTQILIGEDFSKREWKALKAALRKARIVRPRFAVASLAEIAYAVRFAGTPEEALVEQRIAQHAAQMPDPEGTAQAIRVKLRAPYRRLGDLLVERGLVTPKRMRKLSDRIGRKGVDALDLLGAQRDIPPRSLAQALSHFAEWKPEIIEVREGASALALKAPVARNDLMETV
mgnify:CR=1 FL=1|tara:strand:- start:615 stop:2789 length:2175 start_codon:yes stop_codon:yes gene_type:complete